MATLMTGFGGITHLLGYLDYVAACIPLADLQFLCDQLATIGTPLGCFFNPMKTHSLTTTSGHSPISDLFLLNLTLATSITGTISQNSTKPRNDIDVLSPCHRPLGIPGKEKQINIVLFVNENKNSNELKRLQSVLHVCQQVESRT
jgi:hypothetical protein